MNKLLRPSSVRRRVSNLFLIPKLLPIAGRECNMTSTVTQRLAPHPSSHGRHLVRLGQFHPPSYYCAHLLLLMAACCRASSPVACCNGAKSFRLHRRGACGISRDIKDVVEITKYIREGGGNWRVIEFGGMLSYQIAPLLDGVGRRSLS